MINLIYTSKIDMQAGREKEEVKKEKEKKKKRPAVKSGCVFDTLL